MTISCKVIRLLQYSRWSRAQVIIIVARFIKFIYFHYKINKLGNACRIFASFLSTIWSKMYYGSKYALIVLSCIVCTQFFTALHGMQMQSSNENSVRPSVHLSNACIVTKWKKICPDFYTIRKIIYPSFLRKRMVGGATPSTWNFGSSNPRWSEISDFEQIITCSTSAVTSSERSLVNTNRKSTTHFPMSLRLSSYIAPKSPKGWLKNANGRFSSKIPLRLKKVCYKVSLCENSQQQSCRAFIGLTIHAKIIGGNVPFYLKFCVKVTVLARNHRFSIYFRP